MAKILGTQKTLRLAGLAQTKPLHFIATLAMLGRLIPRTMGVPDNVGLLCWGNQPPGCLLLV